MKALVAAAALVATLFLVPSAFADRFSAAVDQILAQPYQAEFGFTFATRPRYRLWKFNAPRLGFGYRLAGELSAWRFVIGEPF